MNNSPSGEHRGREDSVFDSIAGPPRDGILIHAHAELESTALPNLQKLVKDNPDNILDDCDVGVLNLIIEDLPEHALMRWQHYRKLFCMAIEGPSMSLSEQVATVSFMAAVRNFVLEHREDGESR